MITASEAKKATNGYQELLQEVEDKIRLCASKNKTEALIDVTGRGQYWDAIVAELRANGYIASVNCGCCSMNISPTLVINWNRDTSKPVTWLDMVKYNLNLG